MIYKNITALALAILLTLGQLSGLNTHVDASKLNLSALSGSTSGGGGNAPRPPSGGGRPGRP